MSRSRDTADIITSFDSKGDLLVGVGDNLVDSLAVGADGYYLSVDETTDTGLKWAEVTPPDYSSDQSVIAGQVFG